MQPRTRPPHLGEGRLELDPFAHLLLAAFEGRFRGSLILWFGEDPPGEHTGAVQLLLEDGITVAADDGWPASGLLQALVPLTVRRSGGYRFLPRTDALGSRPTAMRGHIDPFLLLTTALRGPVREDAIEPMLPVGDDQLLRLRPGCPLSRFGFTGQEWEFVQELRRDPAPLSQLLARADAPPSFVRRLIYLLRVTGAVTLLPSDRRLPSVRASAAAAPPSLAPPAATLPPTDPGSQQRLVAATGEVGGAAGTTLTPEPSAASAGFSLSDPIVARLPEAFVPRPSLAPPFPDPLPWLPNESSEANESAVAFSSAPPPRHSGTVLRPAADAQLEPRPVPATPPAWLSRDLAFRYREVVRHYQKLQDDDLFQVLGIEPEDDDRMIEDAYNVLEVQWRHEQFPPELAMLRPLVDAIRQGLVEARRTLIQPAHRFAYIERLRRGDGRLSSLAQLGQAGSALDATAPDADTASVRETRPGRPRRAG